MLLIHDGWENISNQFPVAMVRNRFISDGKPFANSFLWRWYGIVSCRIGNYPRTVSCRDDTPSSHAVWETICEQFPVVMLCHRFMPDGKLFANSFLSQ